MVEVLAEAGKTMDWYIQNIKTYDKSAKELAEYFKGIGPRVEDISNALKLAGNPEKPRVIEIGCGDGRDAKEIVKLVNWYEGVDPSKGLLDIARKDLPDTNFTVADALTYKYPENLDVVYAFASLLHVNKKDLGTVFEKVYQSLKVNGIFYISLKEKEVYTEEVKKDKYGERMFYFYNTKIIKKIAPSKFNSIYENSQIHCDTKWFTIALKKI